jgi:hypothetical protein
MTGRKTTKDKDERKMMKERKKEKERENQKYGRKSKLEKIFLKIQGNATSINICLCSVFLLDFPITYLHMYVRFVSFMYVECLPHLFT